MQIVPATPHDEAGIRALLHTCGLPFEDISAAHLAHFFVIRTEARILGTVGLEVRGEFGLLRSLAVSDSWRGQGWAHRLVEQIETYARLQRVSVLYLLTTSAEKFFARLDYQVTPRESAPAPLQGTAEFRSICPDSAVCMRKQL